ncbi:AMP-dependent synthetase/ligase [Inmirania thermothiophila]|uniref:Long-chain acyl-CoA synthetase n=1 Tax=Inmirania thermothiophila TaxID=1750597 RepID=A0A3N1XUH6_9GAMM|nr:long-chain fatty acid--CoA ligase [Inmirania thermothiophila]ROR29841.1 long-chain acyl-CoA synthetase [Inmirania thermothiophila]
MSRFREDYVQPDEARTLGGLFLARARRTPDRVAYRQYDRAAGRWFDTTWAEALAEVARWQQALLGEGLEPGDRVAVMMRNRREWAFLDLAAAGLGLVTVPIYADDRPGNIAYICADAGVRLLVVGGGEEWARVAGVAQELATVERIVAVEPVAGIGREPRLRALAAWLGGGGDYVSRDLDPEGLATIVYTSGTTGNPKGVMLSHRNILENVRAALSVVEALPDDVMLSFLPLSHTLERTAGYYLPMMAGCTVAYARSVAELAEDLVTIRPTILISVPRIYERVHARIEAGLAERPASARALFRAAVAVGWRRFLRRQGRAPWTPALLAWPLLERLVAAKVMARLGGRVRIAVSGGAPLPPAVARLFIGLGLPLLQGYGLTEASPVISVNRLEDNVPESVGAPLPGIEVRIGPEDELLARGPNVMLGYWNNEEATRRVIDAEGWLHTGDKARLDEAGRIYITGRIKDIIVLSNGEKISPADMEMAIAADPAIEQVMIVGEQRPFLAALVVLSEEAWPALAREAGLDPADPAALASRRAEQVVLARIAARISAFPGYAKVRRAHLTLEPWTIENGLITPTLKIRRNRILERYRNQVALLYQGH